MTQANRATEPERRAGDAGIWLRSCVWLTPLLLPSAFEMGIRKLSLSQRQVAVGFNGNRPFADPGAWAGGRHLCYPCVRRDLKGWVSLSCRAGTASRATNWADNQCKVRVWELKYPVPHT